MATRDNLTVAKAIAVAVGLGAILLNIEIAAGFASFHVKPLILGGIVFGGILFGAGKRLSLGAALLMVVNSTPTSLAPFAERKLGAL